MGAVESREEGRIVSDTPQTRDALIEALADVEHQRWSDWQHYVHHDIGYIAEEDGLEMVRKGELSVAADKVAHWERLIATPYTELPKHSKQSDRDQVMRYWPLIVEFFASWLEGPNRGRFPGPDEAAAAWREEMA